VIPCTETVALHVFFQLKGADGWNWSMNSLDNLKDLLSLCFFASKVDYFSLVTLHFVILLYYCTVSGNGPPNHW
jgi:hypothetical protein